MILIIDNSALVGLKFNIILHGLGNIILSANKSIFI